MDENALICSSDFRGGEMRLFRCLICLAASLLFVAGAVGQDPNVKHFDKDGLSFDYPANWQISDQSTQQMQFLELSQGDVVIRVRSPREWLKTPEKEAHAKKLFQDQYVDSFGARNLRRNCRMLWLHALLLELRRETVHVLILKKLLGVGFLFRCL